VNEHSDEDGRVSARRQDGPGGHRLEAADRPLPVWPVVGLDQGQETLTARRWCGPGRGCGDRPVTKSHPALGTSCIPPAVQASEAVSVLVRIGDRSIRAGSFIITPSEADRETTWKTRTPCNRFEVAQIENCVSNQVLDLCRVEAASHNKRHGQKARDARRLARKMLGFPASSRQLPLPSFRGGYERHAMSRTARFTMAHVRVPRDGRTDFLIVSFLAGHPAGLFFCS
jgi:hypothetical protein